MRHDRGAACDLMLTFGSVCSGIEAASVAWHGLGWRALWLAEVDRAASDVLKHRFPDVPNHGDMTLLAGMVRRREIPAPDALVGGTPCQSFSLAGLRRGLSDDRGQLTLAFVDLVNAIDEIRAEDCLPPCIVIWENVPGVLSSKDNAFGCFLAGLAGETDALEPAGRKWTHAVAVLGPERAVAWRILDAQYVGLAQRRRRVFVVAGAGAGFDPAAILLEFDGVRRDSAPSRSAGEGVAGTLAARTDGGGFPGSDEACSGYVQPHHVGVRESAGLNVETEPVPPCWDGRDVSQTLDAVLHKGQTMPEKNRFPAVLQPIPFDTTQITSPGNYSVPKEGDPCHPLAAGAHPPSVAYSVALRGRDGGGDKAHVLTDVCVTDPVTHTLRAEGFDASEDGTGRGQPIVPVGFQASQFGVRIDETAGTLDANYGPRRHNGVLYPAMAVRRLMPVECERLQGFPDGWTAVPIGPKAKPAADGPRYKQLGNSMAVNVMRWLGGRIDAWVRANRSPIGHNSFDMEDLLG